jgi:hypothetical protein
MWLSINRTHGLVIELIIATKKGKRKDSKKGKKILFKSIIGFNFI